MDRQKTNVLIHKKYVKLNLSEQLKHPKTQTILNKINKNKNKCFLMN